MPLKRTSTIHRTTFSRPAPSSVTYELNNPLITTITLPSSSTWTAGAHWHEQHTEYLKVIRGCVLITLDGHSMVCTPSSGTITIPRYARHEWMRADRLPRLLSRQQRVVQHSWLESDSDPGLRKQEAVIVEEWTSPADGQKEAFFRNINSVLTETETPSLCTTSQFLKDWWIMIQLFVIFRNWDNFPVVLDCGTLGPIFPRKIRQFLESAITHGVLNAMAFIGWIGGFKASYEEYTPERLRCDMDSNRA